MPWGVPKALGTGNPLMVVPVGVMLPIWLPSESVNQRLPSGPAVISKDVVKLMGSWNSVKAPDGVICPILPGPDSVNQRLGLPVGPAVMPQGMLEAVGIVNSVMLAVAPARPTYPPPTSAVTR